MATKKQKRAAGEARAAIHRQESIQSGLRAQKRDREHRDAEKKKAENDLASGAWRKTRDKMSKRLNKVQEN